MPLPDNIADSHTIIKVAEIIVLIFHAINLYLSIWSYIDSLLAARRKKKGDQIDNKEEAEIAQMSEGIGSVMSMEDEQRKQSQEIRREKQRKGEEIEESDIGDADITHPPLVFTTTNDAAFKNRNATPRPKSNTERNKIKHQNNFVLDTLSTVLDDAKGWCGTELKITGVEMEQGMALKQESTQGIEGVVKGKMNGKNRFCHSRSSKYSSAGDFQSENNQSEDSCPSSPRLLRRKPRLENLRMRFLEDEVEKESFPRNSADQIAVNEDSSSSSSTPRTSRKKLSVKNLRKRFLENGMDSESFFSNSKERMAENGDDDTDSSSFFPPPPSPTP